MYTVINPVLEGLRIEAAFLAKENWTFRRYSQDLEFVRPVAAMVGYKDRPNFEDFTSSNPEAKSEIDRRDARREELRDACRNAFDKLADNLDFRHKVSKSTEAADRELPGLSDRFTHPAVELYEVVAETVVNKGGVPDHATFYPFWSRFKNEFLQFRKGIKFDHVDHAGRELVKSNDVLSAELSQVRSALAEKYDIPWAPYSDETSALLTR